MGYVKVENQEVATIDFESRSVCDLQKKGAWIYSLDSTTEVMVLRYLLPGMDEPGIWHMEHEQHFICESSPPKDLFKWIDHGGLVEAHNAFFERSLWLNIMQKRYGWPAVPDDKWRCSAAKASAWCLPRDLEGACKAAGVSVQKDMAGRRLMLKMCKPRKPRKAEVLDMKERGIDPASVILYHESEEDIYGLWDYCGTDVLSEHALSQVVPDLSTEELAVWQADQRLNLRGLLFDVDMAEAALELAAKEKKRLNNELNRMTGISAATKRAQIKDWLAVNEDLFLPDTKKDTLEHFMKFEDLSGRATRICEIILEGNKTSTRKYKAIIDKAAPDGRIRDLIMYHGASTGRFSGKGVQIQNFPSRNLMTKDLSQAAKDIKTRDLEWCHALYGNVMELLSSALRACIMAPPGRDMIVSDYSAVEARGVLWLADALSALKVFREGGDIYCDMATGIYGYPVHKKTHPTERQFGKQAILGLGYEMGFVTFLLTCRSYGIHFSEEDVIRAMGRERMREMMNWVRRYLSPTDHAQKLNARKILQRLQVAREKPKEIIHELALMKYTVGVYRERYPEVPQLWRAQEAASIRTAMGAGDTECSKILWTLDGEDDVLYCELPSGRRLTYHSPRVKPTNTSWGAVKSSLSYMGVGQNRKWTRIGLYGGKIVENIVQALCRDIMANSMVLADEEGYGIYEPVLTVHDELGAYVDEGVGSIEDYTRIMEAIPAWAAGCPIAAETQRYKRYRK